MPPELAQTQTLHNTLSPQWAQWNTLLPILPVNVRLGLKDTQKNYQSLHPEH